MNQSIILFEKITTLNKQSDEINEIVNKLYDLKNGIITRIEEVKQKIRKFSPDGKSNHGKQPSVVVKDKAVSLLDRDISHIQNLHDVVVQDLADLKKSLDCHVSIVEKTELIMNILSYKLYEVQYTFRTQFDKLKAKKASLTKLTTAGKEEPGLALRLVEIDDEISKLEETNQNNLECIREQKVDAQKAYERAVQVMDENLDKMNGGLNKLLVLIEAEKSNLSDSQAMLIDQKFTDQVKEFQQNIETFTELQTTGWKIMYPEEKISELLQQRGLKVLQSGKLINESGQELTFKEVKASKLLDDFSPEILKELRANLANANGIATPSTTLSSYSGSYLSSDDVNYLKDCLGKPLTLALAEITSIQPRDPIHYLGHWLFKYRYNQQMEDVNAIELDILTEKRNTIAKEKWHKFVEEEARAAVLDMIVRAEQIGIINELERIRREAEAMEEEMERGFDDEARDTLGPYNGPSTGQRPL